MAKLEYGVLDYDAIDLQGLAGKYWLYSDEDVYFVSDEIFESADLRELFGDSVHESVWDKDEYTLVDFDSMVWTCTAYMTDNERDLDDDGNPIMISYITVVLRPKEDMPLFFRFSSPYGADEVYSYEFKLRLDIDIWSQIDLMIDDISEVDIEFTSDNPYERFPPVSVDIQELWCPFIFPDMKVLRQEDSMSVYEL